MAPESAKPEDIIIEIAETTAQKQEQQKDVANSQLEKQTQEKQTQTLSTADPSKQNNVAATPEPTTTTKTYEDVIKEAENAVKAAENAKKELDEARKTRIDINVIKNTTLKSLEGFLKADQEKLTNASSKEKGRLDKKIAGYKEQINKANEKIKELESKLPTRDKLSTLIKEYNQANKVADEKSKEAKQLGQSQAKIAGIEINAKTDFVKVDQAIMNGERYENAPGLLQKYTDQAKQPLLKREEFIRDPNLSPQQQQQVSNIREADAASKAYENAAKEAENARKTAADAKEPLDKANEARFAAIDATLKAFETEVKRNEAKKAYEKLTTNTPKEERIETIKKYQEAIKVDEAAQKIAKDTAKKVPSYEDLAKLEKGYRDAQKIANEKSQEAFGAALVASAKNEKAGLPIKAAEIRAQETLRQIRESGKELEKGSPAKGVISNRKEVMETAVKNLESAAKIEAQQANQTRDPSVTIAVEANKQAIETKNSRWSQIKDAIKHPLNETRRDLSAGQRGLDEYSKVRDKLNADAGIPNVNPQAQGQNQAQGQGQEQSTGQKVGKGLAIGGGALGGAMIGALAMAAVFPPLAIIGLIIGAIIGGKLTKDAVNEPSAKQGQVISGPPPQQAPQQSPMQQQEAAKTVSTPKPEQTVGQNNAITNGAQVRAPSNEEAQKSQAQFDIMKESLSAKDANPPLSIRPPIPDAKDQKVSDAKGQSTPAPATPAAPAAPASKLPSPFPDDPSAPALLSTKIASQSTTPTAVQTKQNEPQPKTPLADQSITQSVLSTTGQKGAATPPTPIAATQTKQNESQLQTPLADKPITQPVLSTTGQKGAATPPSPPAATQTKQNEPQPKTPLADQSITQSPLRMNSTNTKLTGQQPLLQQGQAGFVKEQAALTNALRSSNITGLTETQKGSQSSSVNISGAKAPEASRNK